MKYVPLFPVVLCCLSFCLNGVANEETVKIDGRLIFEQYFGKDTPTSTLTFDYSVKLMPSSWMIVVTNNNPKYVPYLFESCTWDGTNIYSQWHGEHTNAVSSKAAGGRSAGKRINSATIYEGPVPAWSPCKQELLWMAYASSQFLDGVSTNRLPPIWSSILPMSIVTKHHEAAFWRRYEQSPHLPAEISYLSDSNTVKFIDGKHQLVPRENPEPQYTNAVYQVTEWAGYNGMSFPKSFVLTRRMPIRFGNKILSAVRGETLQVMVSDQVATAKPLPLEGKSFVLDYRSGAALQPATESAKYLATNWPSKQEAMDLQGVKMFPPDTPAQNKSLSLPMWVVMVVVMISSGVLLILVAVNNKKPQSKELV